MDNLEEAERYFQESLDIKTKILPSMHPSTGETLLRLGIVLAATGRAERAEPILRKSLQIWKKSGARKAAQRAVTEATLGHCLALRQQFEEAEVLLISGYHSIEAMNGKPEWRRTRVLERIVDLYEAWGKPEKADEYRALIPVSKDEEKKPETETPKPEP